jgi:AAA domain, putative AbiEii toxin, Type IV TA system
MPTQRRSGSQRSDLGLKRYGREDVEDLEDFTVSSGGTTLGAAWERLFRPLERELRVFTRTLSHLGPLRQEPKRLERYTPTSDRNVGSSGEDMLSLMYDKPFLVTEVNNYLGLMNLPYRLRVVSLAEANPVGSFIYLGLTNRSTDLELSPSDVGVGYSQVLPLIAQSVLSRDSLVCVEQPELHLHPAMQAELGDMFIGQALSGNRVQFLIETHSESLMLRLLRRVREGRIDASRIQVLYVDQLPAGNSEIVELPILPSGEFARPWPHGFFDERLQEFGF